ncbi:hypothetical protein RJ641_019926 [Dillenia turbinata]|uniref:Uncharacterized protein n=1 Tax=Dillenia turbinata TaxID=194707 RepID=A0AAN8UL57_9MAGN
MLPLKSSQTPWFFPFKIIECFLETHEQNQGLFFFLVLLSIMSEGGRQMVQGGFLMSPSNKAFTQEDEDPWIDMEVHEDSMGTTSSISFEDSSSSSIGSPSSLDLLEDASSSSPTTSSPSSSVSDDPLFHISGLMDQLPIKRGLSKFFQGKSQSFTSLSKVSSIEDLAKKENPYNRRVKACKSYGCGLNIHRIHTPKATISKKSSRGLISSSSFTSRKKSFLGSCRPPPFPIQQKNC